MSGLKSTTTRFSTPIPPPITANLRFQAANRPLFVARRGSGRKWQVAMMTHGHVAVVDVTHARDAVLKTRVPFTLYEGGIFSATKGCMIPGARR